MITHYLKLVWNRRRANGLIVTEILLSFLALCAIFSVIVYCSANWMRPLGFEYRNAWSMEVHIAETSLDDKEATRRSLATSRRIIAAMQALPQVEVVAPTPNSPYSGSMSRSGFRTADGSRLHFLSSPTTPDGLDALRLELVQGRWLEPGDEALEFTPYVITQSLAKRLYGNENPLGRTIDNYGDDGKIEPADRPSQVRRVVGVIRDYRKSGEFDDMPYATFRPQSFDDPDRGYAPWSYVIRLAPGTPAVFEETLLKAVQAEAPGWSFTVRSLEVERQRYIRKRLLPVGFGVLLTAFLVLMVGMGLVGVLWQNVTRRTQEMGLRRALGATAGAVRAQILGEILVVTGIALTVGILLFLQLPLLGVFSFVEFGVFLGAILAASLTIVPFVILCGLYPGWLATQVEPSRALQYE